MNPCNGISAWNSVCLYFFSRRSWYSRNTKGCRRHISISEFAEKSVKNKQNITFQPLHPFQDVEMVRVGSERKRYFIRALALVKKKKKKVLWRPWLLLVGAEGLICLDRSTVRKLPWEHLERVEAQENGKGKPLNLDLRSSTPQAAAGSLLPHGMQVASRRLHTVPISWQMSGPWDPEECFVSTRVRHAQGALYRHSPDFEQSK